MSRGCRSSIFYLSTPLSSKNSSLIKSINVIGETNISVRWWSLSSVHFALFRSIIDRFSVSLALCLPSSASSASLPLTIHVLQMLYSHRYCLDHNHLFVIYTFTSIQPTYTQEINNHRASKTRWNYHYCSNKMYVCRESTLMQATSSFVAPFLS